MSRVVLGLGMASAATREEVRALALHVLARAGVDVGDVVLVATRRRFVDDDRARLGPPVVAIDDATLVTCYPADRPTTTTTTTGPRFPARVAEGCALAAAGPHAELVVGTTRSAHATVAIAVAPHPTAGRA